MNSGWISRLRRIGAGKASRNGQPADVKATTSGSQASDLAYLADAPIESSVADKFKRWQFAQRVAETIVNHRDPSSIAIGIYGAWGEGKTSVLNLIEERLESEPNIIPVRFNPWSVDNEPAVVLAFFGTLAQALGKKLPGRKEQLGKLLAASSSLFMVTRVLPGGIDASGLAKSLGERLSSTSIAARRKQIETILVEEKKRVVVLIDDIDRLDRAEIQLVFKLVKLSADFAFTAYVLAFDETMVAAALGEKYGEGTQEAGRSFLEKIVQVPLRLPQVNRAVLYELCLEDVWSAFTDAGILLTQAEQREFAQLFADGLGPRLRTPRMAKRYANALSFALPILKGEVNPIDVALIEGLRTFYPRLYESIRENPRVFLVQPWGILSSPEQHQKTARAIMQAALEGLTEGEINAARSLLETLFPQLEAVLRHTPYFMQTRPEWSLQQRIASTSYFNRYFGYAVPEGELQDQDIQSFLSLAQSANGEGIRTEMVRIIETKAGNQFLAALRLRAELLQEDVARVLIGATRSSGPLLASQSGSGSGSQEQGALLIAALLRRLPSEQQRYQVAKQVVCEAEPVRFAVECLWWIAPTLARQPSLLTPEHEKELGSLLATRIQTMAGQTNILQQSPHEAAPLLDMWARGHSRDETNDYIGAELRRNPTMCIEVLKLFTGQVIEPLGGMLRWPSYTSTDYKALAAVVDPEIVSGGLREQYGSWLDEPMTSAIDISEEQVLAHNFVEFHQAHVRKDQEATTSQAGATNQSETHS
jgi:hypothetical protein